MAFYSVVMKMLTFIGNIYIYKYLCREIVIIYRKALIAAAAVFLTTLPPIFQVNEYII